MAYYSLADVKGHDTPQDLWMVIYNKVYDITNFSANHPGGMEVLVDCAGVDATTLFDDVAHLEVAVKMLLPYLVGELVPHERVNLKGAPEIVKKPLNPPITSDARPLYFLLILVASMAVLGYVGIQKAKWN